MGTYPFDACLADCRIAAIRYSESMLKIAYIHYALFSFVVPQKADYQ